jgi:aspartate kinase
MGSFTSKFGGTSLASAAMMRQAVAIIEKDPRRRFIVPSAPGKRTRDDKKITDLLLTWHAALKNDLDPGHPITIITQRFSELAKELGVAIDIEKEISAIGREAKKYETPDFLASRGEYLNARVLAPLLGAKFVDPAGLILFDYEGRLDETTYEVLGNALKGEGRFVIPGFYGSDPEGRIRTFSRGGSDVTGSIVARATNSDLYENWTDVSGIRMTDPRIVPNARRIDEITYGELRELAYMGASVIHDEAIFPVQRAGIPMNIRNTMQPDDPGTLILPERLPRQPVIGIAAKKGFTMINIEKTMMNREVGLARRALSILEEHRVSFEHMPTSIDSISLIIRDDELKQHGLSIVTAIDRVCQPDRVWLTPGISLIATVGEGMSHHIGVAARLTAALAEARVNLRVLDQGASETNIIIGVNEDDMERAVQAIYSAFENWK